MPGSGRSKTGQTKHDREVRRQAKDYESRGYDVSADVGGFSRPAPVRGYRPDLVVKKGGHTTIVEVETPDSVDSSRDKEQQAAFRREAKGASNKHFRRVVTD